MKQCRSEGIFSLKIIQDNKIVSNVYRKNVVVLMLHMLRVLRSVRICERDQNSSVFGLLTRARSGVLIGSGGLDSGHESTTEKYKGWSIRIRPRFWNGSSSRFGLSIFSETPISNSRRQEYGMAENDSGSPHRLYGRGKRWSFDGRRERFVFRRGEPRCIWTRTKACSGTDATSFGESATEPNPFWGNKRTVILRENWQSE